ncbi:MAG TPA: ADP-ribosylglycohydrolase family protein [Candidatus Dormibacteraeota bacterium]|nr:ADP-ribosylglycohydrolase family protein [Candidatus Dormibacteraeota bacterium]
MTAVPDHEQRIAAALCGAAAASPGHDRGDAFGARSAHDMLAVAESIAERGGLDVDDLRQRQLTDTNGTGLLLRALPFGLSTPLDRPRLRHDAYRYAAFAGADEGTALVCVAAALVAADLLRFDPVMAAIRVRQSLLEDAPMALLNRLTILDPDSEVTAGMVTPTPAADPAANAAPTSEAAAADTDPGAALQAALSVLAWTECAGVSAVLARVGGSGQGGVVALAAALAGAASGACDLPVDAEFAERAGRVAAALASLAAAAVR